MNNMSGAADYASMGYVTKDLKSAMDLYKSQGWESIDVSNRAIEDTASRVMECFTAAKAAKQGDVPYEKAKWH